jgi:hypothetical protein
VGELACQADPLADLPGNSSSGGGTHHHFFPLPESDPLEVAGINRVSSAGGHHSPSPSRQGCGSAFISSGSGSGFSILG